MLIRIARNLHKQMFSIRTRNEKGQWRVSRYEDVIQLDNCTFKISEPGRQRVIERKVKQLHAFVEGTLSELKAGTRKMREVTYNPYKAGHFYYKSDESKVSDGKTLFFGNGKVYEVLDTETNLS